MAALSCLRGPLPFVSWICGYLQGFLTCLISIFLSAGSSTLVFLQRINFSVIFSPRSDRRADPATWYRGSAPGPGLYNQQAPSHSSPLCYHSDWLWDGCMTQTEPIRVNPRTLAEEGILAGRRTGAAAVRRRVSGPKQIRVFSGLQRLGERLLSLSGEVWILLTSV